jgi:hypothetical protein
LVLLAAATVAAAAAASADGNVCSFHQVCACMLLSCGWRFVGYLSGSMW